MPQSKAMKRGTGWFGLKLMLAAAGISIAVKYGGPYLALPERMPVVIGMIFLPTLILSGILWRWQLQSPATPVKKGSLAAEEAETEKSSQPDSD
ncbi:MAG: hypothetical protein Q6L68_00960 [Thermostichus sp. DG02_5_bins_236]